MESSRDCLGVGSLWERLCVVARTPPQSSQGVPHSKGDPLGQKPDPSPWGTGQAVARHPRRPGPVFHASGGLYSCPDCPEGGPSPRVAQSSREGAALSGDLSGHRHSQSGAASSACCCDRWFSKVEPALQARGKPHLVTEYRFFVFVCFFICCWI